MEDVIVEKVRSVFGVNLSRISCNKSTDKTNRTAVKVGRSEAGTLMRATQ